MVAENVLPTLVKKITESEANNKISHRKSTRQINSRINIEQFNDCVTSWRHSYWGNTSIATSKSNTGHSSKMCHQKPQQAHATSILPSRWYWAVYFPLNFHINFVRGRCTPLHDMWSVGNISLTSIIQQYAHRMYILFQYRAENYFRI